MKSTIPSTIIITIDGQAATGKSVCGKILTAKLQWQFLDTGYYYRYLTWLANQKSIQNEDLNSENIQKLLYEAKINHYYDLNKQSFFHQQGDITKQLFTIQTEKLLSVMTQIPAIRYFVTELCRTKCHDKNSILVGRDCGTNIFSNATIKFFLKSSVKIRHERRIKQYSIKQVDAQKSLIDELNQRDFDDLNRKLNPLISAKDAIIIDNSKLNIKETVELMLNKIENYFAAKFPKIMLMGPSNVGKSTLFNTLIAKKVSLVTSKPFTTRDAVKKTAMIGNYPVMLIDSGGMAPKDDKLWQKLIKAQNATIIKETDLFLLIFNVNYCFTDVDRWYFNLIKRLKKPIILVLNKTDLQPTSEQKNSYLKSGISNVVEISALKKHNLIKLEAMMRKNLNQVDHAAIFTETKLKTEINIAMLGQTNVGKSTFFNALAEKNLAFVSELEHTTTNIIKYTFYDQNKLFNLFDTAGLRRKRKKKSIIEWASFQQIQEVLTILDLIILIIDGQKMIVEQEKRIMQLILQNQKQVLIVINKVDLMDKPLPTKTSILRYFPQLLTTNILFCNSLNLRNRHLIWKYCANVHEEMHRQISETKIKKLLWEMNNWLNFNAKGKIYKILFNAGVFEIIVSKIIMQNQRWKYKLNKMIIREINWKFINQYFIYKTLQNYEK